MALKQLFLAIANTKRKLGIVSWQNFITFIYYLFALFFSFYFRHTILKHGKNHTFNYLVLLRKVERQEVDELPNKFSPDWNPNVCMAFVHHFLEQLKQELSLLPEGSFLLIEPEPNSMEFKFSIMDESEMDAIKFFGAEFAVSIYMDKSSRSVRFIALRANNKL